MTENAIADAPESIALIDIAYLFKKNWVLRPGTKNDAALATLHEIDQLARGSDHVIICRDAPPYARKQVFKHYKENRPEVEPEERMQRKFLFEELTRLGYNIACSEGYEADDCIATLARVYGAWCADVRIICPDKDAAQCVTANVVQWIPSTGDRDWERRDADGVEKKFGVRPEQMALYQALMGDASDNVPGVERVGKKTAAELASKYKTLANLAQHVADTTKSGMSVSVVLKSLAANWNDLVLSLKLTTLDTNVPLDANDLLIKREPQPEKQAVPEQDGVDESMLEEAKRLYQEKLPELQALKDAELLEREHDRERRENGEHDAVVVEPGDKGAQPPPKPATNWAAQPQVMKERAKPSGLITVPAYTMGKYGMTSADSQPLDLESATYMAQTFAGGYLYKQFKSWQQVFTILVKAKELRIGITAALGGFHIIEGKPVAHADLIRALAERDPLCEYLMPVEFNERVAIWEGKNKSHPRPVPFKYTIEEAAKAGLLRTKGPGRDNNWLTRPQDMLMKTAGSKLARLLWAGATLGLYCPEEFGYTMEELEEREAA